jgi:hypothetical protein
MDASKITNHFNLYNTLLECVVFCVIIFIFIKIITYITGINSVFKIKVCYCLKVYIIVVVLNIMRIYSNLDCCALYRDVAQSIPLTFNKYIVANSLHANQVEEYINGWAFYTLKNDVIYGHFKYSDCFFTYNYITNTEAKVLTYNYQEYCKLVRENNYPHPLQFRSSYYWLMIYQNMLYCFLIKDRYYEELITSEWFKEYREYETENK